MATSARRACMSRWAASHRLIVADTFVLCIGQEPQAGIVPSLAAKRIPYSLVGGARDAAGLDAVRAIEEGTRAALTI